MQFRRWQETPYVAPPVSTDESTRCLNCGDSFTGNYCPRCGQTKKTRRFTVHNAVVNFFEVWGLTNSAFLRTVIHLLLRPGRMIGDYLRGHRQPYFPPIRMLFIIVAVFVIVDYLLPQFVPNPQELGDAMKKDTTTADTVFKMVDLWMKEHVAAFLIILHTLMAVINTYLFRKSPRLPSSTIVENFYAQIYICCQMLILGFISMLLTFPFVFHRVDEINEWIGTIVYVLDYKQLYGMSWWGTIWRTAVSFALILAVLMLIYVLIILAYDVYVSPS